MSKNLVAYFTASGMTEGLARTISAATGGELYEIKPEVPYKNADLDWKNKDSRSVKEMNDLSSRPGIVDGVLDMTQYETIFLGFPMWFYLAPTIVNTFLEKNTFDGQKIVLFGTSRGSEIGKAADGLKDSCPGAEIVAGKVFEGYESSDELQAWVDSLEF